MKSLKALPVIPVVKPNTISLNHSEKENILRNFKSQNQLNFDALNQEIEMGKSSIVGDYLMEQNVLT
jgi:hypothetical protein